MGQAGITLTAMYANKKGSGSMHFSFRSFPVTPSLALPQGLPLRSVSHIGGSLSSLLFLEQFRQRHLSSSVGVCCVCASSAWEKFKPSHEVCKHPAQHTHAMGPRTSRPLSARTRPPAVPRFAHVQCRAHLLTNVLHVPPLFRPRARLVPLELSFFFVIRLPVYFLLPFCLEPHVKSLGWRLAIAR